MILIFGAIKAGSKRPLDGNGRTYWSTDFGVDYKIVTDTTTWTTVFNRRGIIYGVYCMASATWTASTNYFRQAASTNAIVIPNLTLAAKSTRIVGNPVAESTNFIPTKAIYAISGLKVRPGASIPKNAAGVENETTLYILYWSR